MVFVLVLVSVSVSVACICGERTYVHLLDNVVVNQLVYFHRNVLCNILLFRASVSEGFTFLDVLSTLYYCPVLYSAKSAVGEE